MPQDQQSWHCKLATEKSFLADILSKHQDSNSWLWPIYSCINSVIILELNDLLLLTDWLTKTMRAQASQTYQDKNQIETKMWYHVGVSFMSKTVVQDPNTQTYIPHRWMVYFTNTDWLVWKWLASTMFKLVYKLYPLLSSIFWKKKTPKKHSKPYKKSWSFVHRCSQ